MRARLLLLTAALAAFGGSLFAGFHLDDYAIFSDTSQRALAWPHPLTHLLDWLNYQAAWQEPLAYHAVNLLLHLGAVLLAYECLRRLLPPTAAVIAAAIFAVHPLPAEAVNYVAARGVTIAALLCFAALLAWIEGQPWLAVAAFAAALLANQQCAGFPLVLLVVDRRRKVPLAIAATLAVAAILHGVQHYAFALPAARILRLFLLPWGFTVAPDVHEPMVLTIAASLVIVGIVANGWRKLRCGSELSWLVVGLFLLMGSYPPNQAADPRAYLPLFAFAAAAGLLLARIPARGVAFGLVVILAAVSISRTYVWMSDERLWREAVRRAPNLVEPKIQLAKSLRAADALELLSRARQQAPYNAEIPAQIGKVLLDEQQYDGAVEELSRAVALDPRNALVFNNRGVALAALGQVPAAEADFERALELDPQLDEARENLKRLGVR